MAAKNLGTKLLAKEDIRRQFDKDPMLTTRKLKENNHGLLHDLSLKVYLII